jgi:glycine dehydrogenase subunit 2
VRAFYGNTGMFIRALAYILANGPDGLRQTTEDAVLNANYIRKKLEDIYELPYKTASMHEVVFSDKRRRRRASKPATSPSASSTTASIPTRSASR